MDNSSTTMDQCISNRSTLYPILLVHGVSVRDDMRHGAWGRIPQKLKELGAQVYFGEQDGWGTPENNALQLLERLPDILADSGAVKINVIAHSKGGLDVRKMIDFFPADEVPIASLTTLSTPHHGSRSLDVLLSSVRPLFTPVGFFFNTLFRQLGDKNPDFIATCRSMTASHMESVNSAQPNLPQLYSQQFACCYHDWKEALLDIVFYSFIRLFDGPNDGLVALESAAYDNYQGELVTSVGKGMSHSQIVDSYEKPFSKKKSLFASQHVSRVLTAPSRDSALPVSGISDTLFGLEDILDFYIALIADLQARGF